MKSAEYSFPDAPRTLSDRTETIGSLEEHFGIVESFHVFIIIKDPSLFIV
jgi:hypothetical protein